MSLPLSPLREIVSRVCTHCMYNEWRGQAIGGEQAVTADTVQPQKVRT